jgi:hypothetical protein
MAETIQQALNRADPNVLADQLRSLKFGDVLRSLPTTIRRRTAAADASVDATAFSTSDQAEEARASTILSAYARAGAGAPGALAVVTYPPVGANDIAIAPNGDIVTLAADAWTDMDVSYTVEKGDVVEVTANVVAATGVLTLPINVTTPGAVMLIEAEAIAATSTGIKEILAPGAASAAGEARLNLAKATVVFAIADAVTTARVRLLINSSVDVSASLASTDFVFV